MARILHQKRSRLVNSNGITTRKSDSAVRNTKLAYAPSTESLLQASAYREFLKGVSKPDRALIGNLGLPVLAVQSGGLVLHSDNDVAGLLRSCTIDAAPFYEISFVSAPAGHLDEYHHLEVRVAKPGLIARTHQIYYTRP
jgi:hypothetical protein